MNDKELEQMIKAKKLIQFPKGRVLNEGCDALVERCDKAGDIMDQLVIQEVNE